MTAKRLHHCQATLPLVALGLALAAPAPMSAQDGTLDPTFFGSGKFNFDGAFSAAIYDVAASGVTPDGSRYWWASGVHNGATAAFGYELRQVQGSVQIDCLYTPPGATNAAITDAAFDANGRLVLLGWAIIGGLQRVVLTRIQNVVPGCGTQDPNFDDTGGNHDGWVIYSLTHDAQPNALAIDPAGGIVAVGRTETPATDKDLLVLRLLASGALDNTFDADGVKTFDWTGGNDRGTAVAVEVDPANALHFWVGGFVTWTGGRTDKDFYVARLSSAGAIESNAAIDFGSTQNEEIDAMAFDRSRRMLYAAGSGVDNNSTAVAAIVRLNISGALDATFDSDGRQTIHFGGTAGTAIDLGRAVAVQTDGKVLLAGVHYANGTSSADFGAARLTSDGQPDATFDGDGRIAVPFDLGSFNGDAAAAVTLQGGRPLLGGSAQLADGTSKPAMVRLRNALIYSDGFESGTVGGWGGHAP